MNQHALFDATLSSGMWEGLSYRRGCESDETRWAETSLVFSDIRSSLSSHRHYYSNSCRSGQVESPAWWWGGKEEPAGVMFRFCGKGVSHWRGRQIQFALRGVIHQDGGGGEGGAAPHGHELKITLVKRHVGAFSNVVQYEGSFAGVAYRRRAARECCSCRVRVG